MVTPLPIFFQLVILTATAAAAAASSSFSSPGSQPRQTVSFDFGWKHRAGLHHWPTDPYEPPINTTGIGYVDPGAEPPEAHTKHNTSSWIDVNLPHDGLISNPFGNAPSLQACPDGCSGRSYIPRHVLWYRKEFKLPTSTSALGSSWQTELLKGTSSIFLRFDGSFRNTTVYLNGKRIFQHECGYTPFRIELTPHNLGLIPTGSESTIADATNTDSHHSIAVFVDPNNGDYGGPSKASGWWYEGGGLYRHVWLEKVSKKARIAHEGVFVTSTLSSSLDSANDARNDAKNNATMFIQATYEILDGGSYCLRAVISETGERKINGTDKKRTPLRFITPEFDPKDAADKKPKKKTITIPYDVPYPKVWTSTSPHLYKITVQVFDCPNGDSKTLLDEVTVHHGIRSIRFDPNTGFYWNEEPYKIRGFCDHDTFAVVGMAVPDRINLFRAQASRSIGGNARRASHNPPDPVALDIYDRLGMVVIDENRLFDNNTQYVKNMADLVKRDRNHPSVIVWSFCNEVGCEGDHEAGGPAFQSVATTLDGSRPTLANMFTFHDLLSDTIDVQGFSHRHRDTLDKCHADLPDKPIIQSECCSCNTMRDVDQGRETMSDNPHTPYDQKSFNARCLENLVNASDGTEYSSGTFVWTLLDYYGEPPSKPLTVSSTYGQFDLCGFPKASAFWFRSQWILPPPQQESSADNTTATVASSRRLHSLQHTKAIVNGRPFDVDQDKVEVHIVESWEKPNPPCDRDNNCNKTIHVYSNAPIVELLVAYNESAPQSLGQRTLVQMIDGNEGTYGEWIDIPWNPGSILAVAKSESGTELARTRRYTTATTKGSNQNETPKLRWVLSLDCPSPQTGTGSSLFLDGTDVALVRATLVDDTTNRTMVGDSSQFVSFRIVSGPGMILGTANGDAHSKSSHTNHYHTAFHGLVRAVVKVTSLAGLSETERQVLQSMEIGHVQSEKASTVSGDGSSSFLSYYDTRDIVIEATSDGLPPARLTIPTSTNYHKDSVLSIAARGAGRPVDLIMGHN